jgi:putrescine transport system substrate-binding protein
LSDPGIYPDAETMKRLYAVKARDPRSQRVMNRLWTRIKTGR